jgi:glucuronate isomerase
MSQFLNENFLLKNRTAVSLFHQYAKQMPIFDFHCHISPEEIAQDKTYGNITQVWLYGDHYKWRAMRENGVDEAYITGNAGDREKFQKWAETLPYCVGNPVYIWSHLELRRFFGIEKTLNPDTAEEIWRQTGEMLRGGLSARRLIEASNVKALCTTDNPVDSLEYHRQLRDDPSFHVRVLPAFRPDVFLRIGESGFPGWAAKLSKAAGIAVVDAASLAQALRQRIDFFHETGCRLSDHALDPAVYEPCTPDQANEIVKKALAGRIPDGTETAMYKTWLLLTLAAEYAKHGWVMQFHLSALRNLNSVMYEKLGADTGFDGAGDFSCAKAIRGLLDAMNSAGALPKTILYSLNPNDYEVLLSVGCAFSEKVPGKIQLGSAWWFNDHRCGITRQLEATANVGLLGRFVGMLTDSRSFLSYPRHEYFRRILCNLLGEWSENGEINDDIPSLGKTVQDICYNNARDFLGADLD